MPKNAKWNQWRSILTQYGYGESDITAICQATLTNVQRQYARLSDDESVYAAFYFLVALAAGIRTRKASRELRDKGININYTWKGYQLSKHLTSWLDGHIESQEYSELVKRAASEGIVHWYVGNAETQEILFPGENPEQLIWNKCSKGDGFSDLVRTVLSRITEKYLNYYIEREASALITDLEKRFALRSDLRQHLDVISKQAFESTEITQGFIAGWFNKWAKEGIPEKSTIKAFVAYLFKKMQSEFLGEKEAMR